MCGRWCVPVAEFQAERREQLERERDLASEDPLADLVARREHIEGVAEWLVCEHRMMAKEEPNSCPEQFGRGVSHALAHAMRCVPFLGRNLGTYEDPVSLPAQFWHKLHSDWVSCSDKLKIHGQVVEEGGTGFPEADWSHLSECTGLTRRYVMMMAKASKQ